ncbi:MAG: RNA polymerase sigma factor SigZ [Schleiferiaceae bacterium]|jgi:RNA polymerase sigma-70 factor (ECF subfamily)|nr:RNA polymerase sigma factor SigZ [Schleiferiaceae bacterium]
MTARIWDSFNDELLGFIKSRVKDSDLAQDILQEVFIKIHQKLPSLKSEDKLTSWVYQITRNTIIDHFRKKGNTEKLEDQIAKHLPDEIAEVNKDFSSCISPFIEDLPVKYKDVLQQTVFAGTSQKEYADQHDLSYSAVKSRVQRGREMLKNAFIDCCNLEADKYGNIISSKEDCDC